MGSVSHTLVVGDVMEPVIAQPALENTPVSEGGRNANARY
jgi:hypothetical protein